MEPSAGAVVTISVPPDLPFPLMQGAPQPLSASGPQVTRLHTHVVGHIALPYLPLCGATPHLSLHELEGWGS